VFSDHEKDLIQKSWRLLVPSAETAADLFYRRVFELKPEYRSLFGDDMTAHQRELMRVLAFVVRSLEWPDEHWRRDVDPAEDLMLVMLALGRRQRDLEIPAESYAVASEALIWTLERSLGDALTPGTREAWLKLCSSLATAMQMGEKAIFPTDLGVAQGLADDASVRQRTAAGIGNAPGLTEDAQ
jgi:hemoglobin-like flavoprotein